MPTPREPLVYDVTVEAMFSRALKGRLSPRLKTRVKEEGIDLDVHHSPGRRVRAHVRARTRRSRFTAGSRRR